MFYRYHYGRMEHPRNTFITKIVAIGYTYLINGTRIMFLYTKVNYDVKGILHHDTITYVSWILV